MKRNGGGPSGGRNAKRPRPYNPSQADKSHPHRRSHHSVPQPSTESPSSAPNLSMTTTLPTPLPPLPAIHDPTNATLAFTHTSVAHYATETYDRLEWYGDSVIEMAATDFLWDMYPTLPSGRLSQVREALVNNARLATFARAYGFDDVSERGRLRVDVVGWRAMSAWSQTKILGDVFEAFVGAVALEDRNGKNSSKHDEEANGDDGPVRNRAEHWLRQLWTPLLLSSDLFADENDKAQEHVKMRASRAFAPSGCGLKVWYEDVGEMGYENKAQQRFPVGFFLKGWGHEKLRLGEGVGQNKKIARARAAQDALNRAAIVPELKQLREKVEAYLAEKRDQKEAEEAEKVQCTQ